jgi:hypothetical protein
VFLQLSHLEHPRIALPPKLQHPPQIEVQEGVTRMKQRVRPDRLKPAMVNKSAEIDRGAMASRKQMWPIEGETTRL